MRLRAVLSIALVAAVTALIQGAAQGPPAGQPAQIFRTATDVVFVDVSVRDGGRPVTGLRAEDFELTDNAVRQRVESVEATSVPIDLTLVVDVSGNLSRPWSKPASMSEVTRAVQQDVAGVTRLLRPEDRVRLLAVDRYVQQIWPMSPVASLGTLEHIEHDGLASLFDTLAAALLQPVEPARRHVVIASTKGRDTLSAIDAQAVRAIAERSDALLHLVMMETAADNDDELAKFQCENMGFCFATERFWEPFQRRLFLGGIKHLLTPDGEAMLSGALATGGNLHKASGLTEPTLAGTFRRAFEDFRSSYMLRYSPQGVRRDGWHAIEVRTPRFRKCVRARRGYGVEETTPPTTSAPAPAPGTLPGIVSNYDRGAYGAVVKALLSTSDPARLMRDFEAGGNPWPATPKREAAFVLDLVEPGLFSSQPQMREQADRILERFSRLIRHPLEPDAFERYWHFAALSMLEGSLHPGEALPFVERALARFPDEPQFVLARAIIADQRWAAPGRVTPTTQKDASQPIDAPAVIRLYGAAVALPETEVEARIRVAYVLHRTGRDAEALAHLAAAGGKPIADPALGYLRLLVLGHVHATLDRRAEAIEAYRGALAVVPGAQSARVALMNELLVSGQREEAERLAELVQTGGKESMDPWWTSWQGQYRMYPQAMARVRELMR